MSKRRKNEYTTLKIPKKLAGLVDSFIDEHPEYTSRTDVVKEALRNYLKEDWEFINFSIHSIQTISGSECFSEIFWNKSRGISILTYSFSIFW